MTQTQVESQVESWNWNMNVFEIYDEIRDYSERHQKQFAAIFGNIWLILRFFAIDIILTINSYDAFVACSRMAYFLRGSHGKQVHNQ